MAEPGDITVINTMSIKNNAPAPIVRSSEALGTFKNVADPTARDAIPDYNREEGMPCYVVSEDKWYQLKGGIANTDWQEVSLGGASTRVEQLFTPVVPGQVTFILTQAPAVADDTSLYVNTVKYIYGVHFVVSGSTLTWLDIGFTLDHLDTLEAIYFV